MATDQADTDAGDSDVGEDGVTVGEYTWPEFMRDHGHADEADDVARGDRSGENGAAAPEFDRVAFDPETYLGFDPGETGEHTRDAVVDGSELWEEFRRYIEETPVEKDEYLWEHYKWEYYYEEGGVRPREDGEVQPFVASEELGFAPEDTEGVLSNGENIAAELAEVVDRRTVDINPEVDEEEFFTTIEGHTTLSNRYDLEKAVPMEKKGHFKEIERYWTNKPYSFVVLFHSERENEMKYYVVEPYRTSIEDDLRSFLSGKLRAAIKYASEDVVVEGGEGERRDVIENETRKLLDRYDLYEEPSGPSLGERVQGALGRGGGSGSESLITGVKSAVGSDDPVLEGLKPSVGGGANGSLGERMRGAFGDDGADGSLLERVRSSLGSTDQPEEEGQLEGIMARPEPVLLAEDSDTLSEYQVEKLLYYLKRDFIGYERIDSIKHDINVEDISCDGWDSPVFVYHTDYEQIISNVVHGKESLDNFVVKLAQRSGKGISKRQPQVDATLPDGSRAQLTLGEEVSDHGTNYTIRQFKDVPFTPVDQINWRTFSLDQMAFLWLAIENHKSLMVAGGTASGKTTALNALSLFIPANTKIVSIEDTREVELPQRNWVASVTRPSFSDDEQGDIDEFDLLEGALRQRPDYIVMGEVRGEEGRTLFQVMSTGHTTYTTFHADSVAEVLKRFTTDPINVSKTLFTALDLVAIQRQTRLNGQKVRKNATLTEINHYDAENDEINVQDVYKWLPDNDQFQKQPGSNTLQEIAFDRGWSQAELDEALAKRKVVLAYLIDRELNTYAQVAATCQAFIQDQDTILTLMANDQLEDSLENLREMESVFIDVDAEDEELVPRPEPGEKTLETVEEILEEAETELFEEYRGEDASDIALALSGDPTEEDVVVEEALDGDPTAPLEPPPTDDGAAANGDESADEVVEPPASEEAEPPDTDAEEAAAAPEPTSAGAASLQTDDDAEEEAE